MLAKRAGRPKKPNMKTLGVLGGMGPLAEPEQAASKGILYSDPSFPDRTEAILRGDTRELAVSP
jgi:aspartate racemase